MKFIDKCIKNGWTSKGIREIDDLKDNVFAQVLSDGIEWHEKTILRKKKLEQLKNNLKI